MSYVWEHLQTETVTSRNRSKRVSVYGLVTSSHTLNTRDREKVTEPVEKI